MKENEVFHHTFCIIIRTIMKLECFLWTNCLKRHLVHTFLSYSDLKCNFNYAIHMKTSKKMMFLVNFCLHFFSFSEVEILRKLNTRKFCILKNIVLSVIDLGRELCFLFFHFFISYANLEFRPASCQ